MSAHLDYAHQRFEGALEKYSLLLRYYTASRNDTLTALVLNGMGEVHGRLGDRERAARCFEAALAPATAQSGPPPVPVLLNLTLNLANLRLGEENWEAAEAYYDAAQQFATVQRAALTKLQAMEDLGYCQYRQGKIPEALGSWNAVVAVAAELEQPDHERSACDRLLAHYRETGDQRGCLEIERRLARLEQPA